MTSDKQDRLLQEVENLHNVIAQIHLDFQQHCANSGTPTEKHLQELCDHYWSLRTVYTTVLSRQIEVVFEELS